MLIEKIIFENESFAVLYKPRGIPTAPIKQNETETLLHYFLQLHPECMNVHGKKEIEAGLIHRLDTPTSGLVLIAKTQSVYDELIFLQRKNLITKTYTAFCQNITAQKIIDDFKIDTVILPYTIKSRFRPFGPKGKKVMPSFTGMKKFTQDGKLYETHIVNIKKSGDDVEITCTLTQGYRHQVRSHLAAIGLPICCDGLYNPNYTCKNEELQNHSYPLQLYAVGISFPILKSSPDNFLNECTTDNFISIKNGYISFLLPPPNKTSR